MRLPLLIAAVAFLTVATPSPGQWLKHPTPGIPRLADGKPDLRAPVPKTAAGRPDLSGIWISACGQGCPVERRPGFNLAQGLPSSAVEMTPWAAAVQKQRLARSIVDDPLGYCLPPGVPRIMFTAGGFKIVQTPTIMVLLHETQVMMTFRQVFTDGRALPVEPEPTWLGYSVGRWDGDTFVIDTTGFRDNGWLDLSHARPHSDALRVTERLRRLNFGQMELTVTIDDPKAYTKPWTVTAPLVLAPDTELLEAFCESHDKTMEHRRVDPAPPEPPSPRSPSR